MGCGLLAVLASALSSWAARDIGPVAQTAEWQRLVNLWHGMLDHSSDLIYSRPLFDELVKSLDKADADVTALADRRLLPRPVADGLRRLVHARYQYIRDYHYTDQAYLTITDAESARGAANWITELQLSVLRRAYRDPERNRELIAAAEFNLTYELTFLYHLDKFETEAEQRRANLKTREEKGEKVDWQAFDNDCLRRRALLLEAYAERRIPRARPVDDLLPYLLALTRARPSRPTSASDLHTPEL